MCPGLPGMGRGLFLPAHVVLNQMLHQQQTRRELYSSLQKFDLHPLPLPIPCFPPLILQHLHPARHVAWMAGYVHRLLRIYPEA